MSSESSRSRYWGSVHARATIRAPFTGEADRVAGLDPRRVDAAGAVVGHRPAAEGLDDLPDVPAHVPRHPGVMVRVPGPHPDPAAGGVGHMTPFSATSSSRAPSQR